MSTGPNALTTAIRSKYPGVYDDLSDDVLTKQVLTKHPEYSDMVPEAAQALHPTVAPVSQRALKSMAANAEIHAPMPGSFEGHPENIGGYVGDTASGFGSGVKDIATGKVARGTHSLVQAVGLAAMPATPFIAAAAPAAFAFGTGGGIVGQKAGKKLGDAIGMTPDQSDVLGDAAGFVGGYAGAVGGSRAGSTIQDLAMENPDVAAQKALRPPAKRALRAEAAVDTARPYLKGASSLEDLQGRTATARNEIWQPYKDALAKVGKSVVDGPDGPNTVEYYEGKRLETSAQLRSAKNMMPSDLQTAMQKGQAVADLVQREKAIKASIDPELQKTGLDPELVRKTFGGVKTIQGLTEGRSTMTESQPYGFGKMADQFSLTRPAQSLKGAIGGIKDIAAGRPLWEGSPTDIAVKEGFRVGGDKPNLTPFPSQINYSPTRGLLGTGPKITPFPDNSGPVDLGQPEVQPLAENRQLPPVGRTSGPRTTSGPSQYGISLPERTPRPLSGPDRQLPQYASAFGTGLPPDAVVPSPNVNRKPPTFEMPQSSYRPGDEEASLGARAKNEVDSLHDLWSDMPRPGRFVIDVGEQSGDEVRRPENYVYGIKSPKPYVEDMHPWLRDLPMMSLSRVKAAVAKGSGVDYQRIIQAATEYLKKNGR